MFGRTFDADDVIPDLLGYNTVRDQVDQVVDSVYRGMDALEPLDLLPDRQGVVEEGLQVRPGVHFGNFSRTHEVTRARTQAHRHVNMSGRRNTSAVIVGNARTGEKGPARTAIVAEVSDVTRTKVDFCRLHATDLTFKPPPPEHAL